MSDAGQIAVLLVELYVAFGVMLIGFGYMFAGKTGGGRVAQFYFGGSLRWTLRRLRALVVGVLTSLWGLCVLALAGIGRAIVRIARHARRRLRPRERKACGIRAPTFRAGRQAIAGRHRPMAQALRWHAQHHVLAVPVLRRRCHLSDQSHPPAAQLAVRCSPCSAVSSSTSSAGPAAASTVRGWRSLVLLLATAAAAAQTVTVQATQHNMYQADVTLNNQLTASALIDTGATYLSLCGAAAKTLGLELGRSVVLRTANGDITSRLTVRQKRAHRRHRGARCRGRRRSRGRALP